jgi:hypothetical protein
MSQEAMKLALEALGAYMSATDTEEDEKAHSLMADAFFKLKETIEEAEKQDHNFCSRCGKRLGKNDWDIHTCTPPQEKNNG